jgi:hypothetical protein
MIWAFDVNDLNPVPFAPDPKSKASVGRFSSVAGDTGAEPSDWDNVPVWYVLLRLERAAVALESCFPGRYKSIPVNAATESLLRRALMRYRLLLDIRLQH